MEDLNWDDLKTMPDMSHQCHCPPDLTQALTVAHVSQGMDPLKAAMEAHLQAPLIEPLLF
jgi:hypothetical protein